VIALAGRAWLIILTLVLAVVAVLSFAGPAARADALTGTTAPAEAAAGTDEPALWQRGMATFIRWQRDVNKALGDGIVAVKDGHSSMAVVMAILLAFSYGAFHAVGPGHGKTVILAYFLSRDGSLLRGIRMGAQIALMHVISAVVIVIVVRWLLGFTFAEPVDQLQSLKLFSYGTITVVGAVMLARTLQVVRQPPAGHAHDCHHHRASGERDLLSIAVGLIPCSGAVLVLIYALANGLLLGGLVMTACIAIGMAITLSVIGMAAAWARARAVDSGRAASPRRRRFVRAALDLAGPLLITLFGAALTLSAFA
jgi:nickel/cobalt transporter (NicO) family protein